MVKLSKKNKEMLNRMKKDILSAGGGLVLGTAFVASAAAGPAGVAVVGTAVAILATKKHLSAGFKAGLKKWQQKDNQPLSLRAKLLKFRNAISVGMATTNKSLEKENMDRNPFFKAACEKAAKEGRKVKLSERFKAAMQFSAARHETHMLHKTTMDNLLASYRQRRP